jgi:hypothetical protein
MYIVVPGVIYVPMFWLPWTCLRGASIVRSVEDFGDGSLGAGDGSSPTRRGTTPRAPVQRQGSERGASTGDHGGCSCVASCNCSVDGASSVENVVSARQAFFACMFGCGRSRSRGQALLALRHTFSSLLPLHHLQAHARASPPLRCTPSRWTRRAAAAPPPPRMAWGGPGGG